MRPLCNSCSLIAQRPHASHDPAALRLSKVDYSFFGTRDGTGAAATQCHYTCDVCAARWTVRANPDGTCCDWKLGA
jgi:hypothetical protein